MIQRHAVLLYLISYSLVMLKAVDVQAKSIPTSVEERFNIAEAAYRDALITQDQIKWDRVLAYYRHLAENVGENHYQERAHMGLAETYAVQGERWKAITALDRAIRLSGVNRDWILYRKAMLLMLESRDAANSATARNYRRQAVETYQRIVDEFPDSRWSPQALFFVANNQLAYFRSKTRAEKAYRELIQRYPSSPEAEHAARLLPHMDKLSEKQLQAISN